VGASEVLKLLYRTFNHFVVGKVINQVLFFPLVLEERFIWDHQEGGNIKDSPS